MKRRIFVKKTFAKFGKILICGAVMAAMCGCSAGLPFTAPKTADFDTRYSVNADITCGELEASAEIKRKLAILLYRAQTAFWADALS